MTCTEALANLIWIYYELIDGAFDSHTYPITQNGWYPLFNSSETSMPCSLIATKDWFTLCAAASCDSKCLNLYTNEIQNAHAHAHKLITQLHVEADKFTRFYLTNYLIVFCRILWMSRAVLWKAYVITLAECIDGGAKIIPSLFSTWT